MAKNSIEVKDRTVVNEVKDRIASDESKVSIGSNRIENFIKIKKDKEKQLIEIKSDDLEVVENPTPEQLMEFQGRDRVGKVILGKLNRLYGYCNKTNVACLLKVDTARRVLEAQKKNIA